MKISINTYMILLLIFGHYSMAQDMYSNILSRYNEGTVPYITVEELVSNPENIIFLDAREEEEYNISHIPGAIYVGFEDFSIDDTTKQLPNQSQKIAIYCSLGVRSETIAEQLKAKGYFNVFNLYGGIFEWVNQNQPVLNKNEQLTDSVHVYSERWGKFLNRGIKIYE